MKALLRLELAKLWNWRSLLYVLLPNLYPLAYTLALGAALLSGSQTWLALVGAFVTGSLALHPMIAMTAYPLCIALLCSDLWCSEAGDRSLRTLVLMQVPRGRLLAVRVMVVTAVSLVAFAIYFALFFAHAAVLRRTVMPEVWARVGFPIAQAMANVAPLAAGFAIGVVALTLWSTLISLAGSHAPAATMLSMMTLAALAMLPTVEGWVQPDSQWSQLLFTQQYVKLTGSEVLKALVRGDRAWGEDLGRAGGMLLANAAVLYPVVWWVLRGREFAE